MRVIVACCTVLLTAGAAGAQGLAAQLDPWSLGQAPEYCHLSRTVDAGGQKANVLIQSYGMDSPYHVVVSSTALPLRPQRAEVARIEFGGPSTAQDTFVILGKWNNVATAVFAASWHNVRQGGEIYAYKGTNARILAPIDQTGQVLALRVPDAAPLELKLGNMSAEFERLDSCTKALEARWRAAASPAATAVKEPELLHPGEANWHMKYPNIALLNLVSGITELRMTVDAKGRARDCVVQGSTWAPQFGADACAALKTSARFEPARDSQGNPVAALYRASLIFINYKWS